MKNYFFYVFYYVFICFPHDFLCFSFDFCKGRTSKNTLQVALNTPQNPSLTNFLCFDPCKGCRVSCPEHRKDPLIGTKKDELECLI